MASRQPSTWRAFARAALASGLSAGFGLGGLLFVALLTGDANGAWWPAAAQAHGHAQIFGFAGLMVLGVGLHFLPRLASIPAIPTGRVRLAYAIIVAGLTARVICQTVLGWADSGLVADLLRLGWAAGAFAELAGAALILAGLADSLRSALPLRPEAAIRPVLPLLAAGFVALLAYLGGSALAALDATRQSATLIPDQRSTDLALLGLWGFLTPISVAMSIRIFPLYFRTYPARNRLAHAGLALLAIGLLLRLASGSSLESAGRCSVLLAVIAFPVAARVFEPRRPLPRRVVRIWQDAPGLHVLSAYLWLLAAGLAGLGGERWTGLELHLLGAGFVMHLILGSGVHLIPGFARQPLRAPRYVWATLATATLATAFRAAPALPGLHLDPAVERTLGATAGLAGLAALALFAFNLWGALSGGD